MTWKKTQTCALKFFLCFSLALILTGKVYAASEDGSEIRLIFTKDDQPVPGVIMFVGDDEVTTNENGKASFDALSGVHTITLVKDDIDLAVLNVVVSFDETLTILANVQDDADVPSIEIESTGVSGANAASGNGSVSGELISGNNSEPVANAKIIILGSAADIVTDAEGKFELSDLPGGTYGLTVTHDEYRAYTIDHFVVVANEPINLDILLFPILKANVDTNIGDIAIEEVIVTAKFVADESSIAGALEAVRLSSDVTELISADQIAKSGASDAAAALRRVTGVNVSSNNFANIRGLPSRYTKTTWNGSEIPSTDPVRRTVPLDLFPADVLRGIQVQKSYSADKPGEFAGGLIDLQTINIPSESYFKLSIGTDANTETTFRRGFTYDGGDDDFFGVDDGTRELPGIIDDLTNGGRRPVPFNLSPSVLNTLDSAFDDTLTVSEKNIAPGVELSLSGGNRWDFDWGALGVNSAFTFDNEWQTRSGPRNNDIGFRASTPTVTSNIASVGISQGITEPTDEFQTTNEVTLGGLLALGAELGEGTQLSSNTFLYRQTLDVARERTTETDSNQIIDETTLEFTENEFFSQQFLGKHNIASYFNLPFGLDIDWRYIESRTSRDVPDRRLVTYINNLDNENLDFVFSDSNFQRTYDFTIDKLRNVAGDITLSLWEDTSFSSKFKAGISKLVQRRDSEFEQFGIENNVNPIPINILLDPNPENVVQNPIFDFDQGFAGELGNADGRQEVNATYFTIEQNLFDRVSINAGVRYEDSEINIQSFAGNFPVAVENSQEDYFELPGIAATVNLTDDMQLRLGWSETISRPNIRELTAINFIDTVLNEDFIGNPNLVTTEIENRDIRWEWYFGDSENLSLAYFEKDFTNPIEIIAQLVAGDNDSFDLTYQNAIEAEADGIELGWRKNLAFFGEMFEDVYLFGNYSVIDSEVIADINVSQNAQSLETRALQGQPDWLLNFAISYETENTEATLLYNRVDDYINFVGNIIGGVSDEKEADFIVESVPSLDFIFKKKIYDEFSLGFKVRNILNPLREITQAGDTVTSFQTGQEFSLTLGWEPF